MVTIARITEIELDALHNLRAESLREGFRFIERLCEEWASGINRFTAPGEALFAAFDDSQIVGICGLNRDPHVSDSLIGRVRQLYVVPAFRRHGVGKALLRTVVAHARGTFSVLRVRTDLADTFYVNEGFERVDSDAEFTHILELINAG